MRARRAFGALFATLPGASLIAAGAVLLALAPEPAAASTVIELSVGELATRATAVVAGTPVERKSVWESAGGARTQRIVTYTRVHVDRLIAGQMGAAGGAAQPAEVWVRTLGGEVEGIGQHVDGEAVLPMAQPTLLFLTARADGTHGVVGMAQGNYPLEAAAGGAGVTAMRVTVPTGLGRVVPRVGTTTAARPAARIVLPGQSLDDVAKLITAERQAAHAP